ncbi:MAG: hypothetical protein K2X64_00910, partial [Rhodocyclaceae bacterium]|nr:hypothetical protein [Rhodocyclaceae bacterium]
HSHRYEAKRPARECGLAVGDCISAALAPVTADVLPHVFAAHNAANKPTLLAPAGARSCQFH